MFPSARDKNRNTQCDIFAPGLKGQQLTGYYHPLKGYKSILVTAVKSSFFPPSTALNKNL